MRVSTLAALRDALVAFCEQHPEFADEAVSVHSECGYAGAYIAYPVTLYKGKAHKSVSIFTDDDLGTVTLLRRYGIENDDDFNVYKIT